MTTQLNIKEISIDNADVIIKELQNGKLWQLHIFDATEEEQKLVGVFLQHYDDRKDCTIMFEITKEEALFFGKSLIALSESI
tara:strand:- start:1037 stop:1282 length:246 start_codon:yes stop_codon:yes gene_type:complete